MATEQQERAGRKAVIDLASTPYFASEPLVVREASGLERVREISDEAATAASYRADRKPLPTDPNLRFGGGLGTASVLDVAAHPIRARMRSINVLNVVAISVVAAIAIVIATLVVTFHH